MSTSNVCDGKYMGADSISNGKGTALIKNIFLVGNPNSGKTTLFNVLTGNRHKVANYPGVTVEKRTGTLVSKKFSDITVTDLPGTYSIRGQSIDERLAEKEVLKAKAENSIILVVVDASNLDRNLYLVSELMDLDARLIVALNMSDIAKKDGVHIKEVLFARELGVPVVSIAARISKTVDPLRELIEGCVQCSETYQCHPPLKAWVQDSPDLEDIAQKSSADLTLEEAGRVAAARYAWIKRILERCVTREGGRAPKSDKIDTIILHPIFGSLLFFALMAIVFQAVFAWASIPMDFIDGAVASIGQSIQGMMPPGILRSLIVDGIITGVGSVIIFVPQIAILFFLICLLEQSGYLCRAAVLMDRLMRQVGLQGRSFIPLLSSFACAIPGIMATRAIPSHSDRLVTILVAPLMSCSARLPVYAVLIAAFIPNTYVLGFVSLQGLTLFALYLLGILGAAAVAWILKVTVLRGEPSLFLMELPRYKVPLLKSVAIEIWDRVLIFLKDAGSIILACSIVLWFLAAFPRGEDGSVSVKDSYAGQIGQAIEPVIKPLGYDWQIGVSLLASFAAREVFISSLSTVYSLDDQEDEIESLTNHLKKRAGKENGITTATALSLLVFYVFACQCMSTLAVCKRETGSWFWPAIMFSYMTLMAYIAAWGTYNIALLMGA